MAELDPEDVVPRRRRVVENVDEDIAGLMAPSFDENKPAEREGLPPDYRMRADSHYVDQLSARSADAPMRLIPIGDIDADPGDASDVRALKALTQSIAELGVVQPLLVRRDGARYKLIAGRQRLAAARAAGLPRVPCLVHSVDETQAEALARAAAVRVGVSKAASPAADSRSGVDAHVIVQVTEAIGTIQSATTLFADEGSAMVRRVALDLVRASTWRAAWQLRAAAILDQAHRWNIRTHLLGAILGRVRDGFAAEGRLRGIDLQLHVADWNASADVDDDAMVAGISGAIVATAGLMGAGDSPRVRLSADRAKGGAIVIEIAQDAQAPEAAAAERFFDPGWTDRPGGRPALIGAAAARAVAQRHGGDAAFAVDGNRGSTVRLTLGRGSRH